MTRTKLIRSGASQVVPLPGGVAFPARVQEVAVLRDGGRRVLVPVDALWDDFFAKLGADLGNRTQPTPQEREGF